MACDVTFLYGRKPNRGNVLHFGAAAAPPGMVITAIIGGTPQCFLQPTNGLIRLLLSIQRMI
jgi:hypothetical protein